MDKNRRMLTIGVLAQRSGVATSALRFYEANGLISSERNESGHRRFAPDTLRRVAFIRTAQKIGLSLNQIEASLAALPGSRTPSADDWTKLAATWRPMLDERIASLARLRDNLEGCIGCGCLSMASCAIWNPDDIADSISSAAGPHYLSTDDRPEGTGGSER